MPTVNRHDAKSRLSSLVEALELGSAAITSKASSRYPIFRMMAIRSIA